MLNNGASCVLGREFMSVFGLGLVRQKEEDVKHTSDERSALEAFARVRYRSRTKKCGATD